jgi:hypothetical protein
MSTTVEIKNFENLLVGDGNLRLHDIRIHDGMIFELSYVRVRLLPEITNQFKKVLMTVQHQYVLRLPSSRDE